MTQLRTEYSENAGQMLRDAATVAVCNFDNEGQVIYTGRNTIKVFDTLAGCLNVKAYRVPSFFNRIIYTFFRKSKGRRAFEYPALMKRAFIDTPAPVAYMEERRFGLIYRSWLVTYQSALSHTMYELGDRDMSDADDRDLVMAFARFTAKMHESGVLHRDYSPGNILFDRDSDGKWSFSLVDVNRMSFGQVSVERGCRNMARLWGQPAMFRILASEYAMARNADPEKCLKELSRAREKFWRRFSRRHTVKYAYRPLC